MNTPVDFDALFFFQTERINVSIEMINTIENLKKSLRDEDFKDLNKILEINDFLIVLNVIRTDCIVISKNFQSRGGPYWERLFYVKSLYLIIHNFFSSYAENGKLLKTIADQVENVGLEHKRIASEIKEFRATYKYEQKIKSVRNLVSAHIDDDWIKNFKLISTISNDQDGDMLLDILLIIRNLINLLLAIMINQEARKFNLIEQLLKKYVELEQKYTRNQ